MSFITSRRPHLHIFVFGALVMVFFLTIDHLLDGNVRNFISREDVATQLFIFLLMFYGAVWLAYFTSIQGKLFKFQTLRVLLWEQSLGNASIDEMRDKGRSVLTVQAVFTAISVFVISAIFNKGSTDYRHMFQNWEAFSTQLILACAVLAVVMLIISADAVETTFNKFKSREEDYVRYFFQLSARRKYFGFVLSILAVILFVSRISPPIGCLGAFAFLVLGYHHWFPTAVENNHRFGIWLFLIEMGLFLVIGEILIG
ncbi:MAG: hypothetical protein VX444_10490 [Pseudomonadota bacterium]|nr:hypothetical protein [Pseudomonadota bacterium]